MRVDSTEALTASSVKVALRVRQLHKMMGAGEEFGVLSADGKSKSQNIARNRDLRMALDTLGYRKVHPLRGRWEGVVEKSVLVPGMRFKDLLDLGNQFEQDSVIFKSRDGVIGMYYLKRPVATLAVDLDSMSPDVQISDRADLYSSKSRGVSFEFNFMWEREIPWDGRRPFRLRDIERVVEADSL